MHQLFRRNLFPCLCFFLHFLRRGHLLSEHGCILLRQLPCWKLLQHGRNHLHDLFSGDVFHPHRCLRLCQLQRRPLPKKRGVGDLLHGVLQREIQRDHGLDPVHLVQRGDLPSKRGGDKLCQLCCRDVLLPNRCQHLSQLPDLPRWPLRRLHGQLELLSLSDGHVPKRDGRDLLCQLWCGHLHLRHCKHELC